MRSNLDKLYPAQSYMENRRRINQDRAPDANQESDNKYRSLFENVHDGIYQSTIDGKILTANPALVKMLGYDSEDELKKMNIGSDLYVYPSDRDASLRKIREESNLEDTELILKKKDGSKIIVLEHSNIVKDSNGKILYYEGTLTDITRRKKAEEDLMLFKHSVDIHYDGAFWMDRNGNFVYVNDAACHDTGYTREELIGQNVSLVNPKASEENMNIIWDVLEKAGSLKTESVHRRKDGSTFPVEIVSSLVRHGSKIYNCGFARDISDRKKNEDELRKNEERFRKLFEKAEESDKLKTAFLHNISHEIRTPMNAIVGFTSLMDSSTLSEETRKQYIDIIVRSSDQLLSIISDIVDISNIETGHIKVSHDNVNINVLMRKIFEQYSYKARKDNISLTINTSLDDNSAVTGCDEIKLIQVISNLLNNAFKFTIKGSIHLGYDLSDDYIVFYVRDTGIGISKENFSRIFDRFYQVDDSTHKTMGTGLGLSLCKAYVELMGGRIWLESTPGKGSIFYFTLPFKKIPGSDATSLLP
jgi:PAS domain S-box-containing protein